MASPTFLPGAPMRPAGSCDLGDGFYFTKADSAAPAMGTQGAATAHLHTAVSLNNFKLC